MLPPSVDALASLASPERATKARSAMGGMASVHFALERAPVHGIRTSESPLV